MSQQKQTKGKGLNNNSLKLEQAEIEIQNEPITNWNENDDSKLCTFIYKYGTNNWEIISKEMGNKSGIQCLQRWNAIMKPNVIKGPWNVDEDKKLIDWIKTNGATNWSACAEFIPGRTGKQCRERWMNALNPLLKKGSWEPEEDYIIFKLFKKLGSKWSTISNYIAGRTENSIKNRFYSTLRRIACELKRIDRDPLKEDDEISEKDCKLTLKNLMAYFDQAYYEKTNYIDNLVANLKLDENEILNSGVLKEILQMYKGGDHQNNVNINGSVISDDKKKVLNSFEFEESSNLLSKKREQSNTNKTHFSNHNHNNFNNNFAPPANLNLNPIVNPIPQYSNQPINNIPPSNKYNLDDKEADNIKKNLFVPYSNSVSNTQNKKEDFKNLSLETLAKRIDSFCKFAQEVNTNTQGKQVTNNKTFAVDSNEVIKEENIKDVHKDAFNAQKIGNLLNQLNDLENLLMITKKELKKIDDQPNEIGYSDKIQSNLHEFEMPLNSNKVFFLDEDKK